MSKIADEVRTLLTAIGPDVQRAYEKIERDRPVKAPSFRPFALLDPKEVVQTRVIASLLDPLGTHAQGEKFLRLFLQQLDADAPNSAIDFAGILFNNNFQQVEILPEYMTRTIESDKRRIDLVIKLPHHYVVAIESKARGARDQRNQLQDYRKELESTFPGRFLLVYLSSDKAINGDETGHWAEWGRERPRKAVRVNYRKFVTAWLDECRKKENCRAPKVQDFLQEFSNYVQTNDVEEGAMDKTIAGVAQVAIESDAKLRAALAVIRSQNAIGLALGRKFMKRLEQSLKERRTENDMVPHVSFHSNYLSLDLKREDWKNIFVRFQIDFAEDGSGVSYWTKEIGYGLCVEGKSASTRPSTAVEAELNRLQAKHLSGGSKTPQWRCFKHWLPRGEAMEDTALLLRNCPDKTVDHLADDLIGLARDLDRVLSRTGGTVRRARS